MARVIFEGLSRAQAKALSDWYEGQGEQTADEWFSNQTTALRAPFTDVQRKGGYRKIDKKTGNVTVYCK